MACKSSLNIPILMHSIDIESKDAGRGVGGVSSNDFTVETSGVPCSIRPIGGGEIERHQHEEHYTTHEITLWYNADLSTAKRINFNDRIFNIKRIITVNEGNMLQVLRVEEEL